MLIPRVQDILKLGCFDIICFKREKTLLPFPNCIKPRCSLPLPVSPLTYYKPRKTLTWLMLAKSV